MGVYCEITLLPNPEVNVHFLWSKVFQQIHLGLVEVQNPEKQVPIGLSFPKYIMRDKSPHLGHQLRLIAENEGILEQFDVQKWLERLSDYVHCTGIRTVPKQILGYANYCRVQPQSNKVRLARRYAKRHHIDEKTALERYASMTEEKINLPFVRMKSLSTNEAFCLYIKKTISSLSSEKQYSTYGLSKFSSVPEF